MPTDWRKQYSRYKDLFLNVLTVYQTRQDVKIFIEILLSLATISFFTAFALRPTAVAIAQIYKEIKSKEETIKKMDQKIQNLQLAQDLLKKNQDKIALLEYAIPSSPFPDKQIRQIESLANIHSASILSVNSDSIIIKGPKSTQTEDLEQFPSGSEILPISLRLTGGFEALIGLITDLQNFRRPFKIDLVTFNSSPEAINELNLAITGRSPYINTEVKK